MSIITATRTVKHDIRTMWADSKIITVLSLALILFCVTATTIMLVGFVSVLLGGFGVIPMTACNPQPMLPCVHLG